MKKTKYYLFAIFFGVLWCFNFVLATDYCEEYTPAPKVYFGDKWEFSAVSCDQATGDFTIPWLSQYIAQVYRYGVGLAGLLAAVMIMAGGYLWLASAGAPDKIKQGKEFITSALLGLFIALFSYLILATVNPNLVSLPGLRVNAIKEPKINDYRDSALVPDFSSYYVDFSNNNTAAKFQYTKKVEGLGLMPYKKNGKLYVGYGHQVTGKEVPPIVEGRKITPQQAEDLFVVDYAAAEKIAASFAGPAWGNKDMTEARKTILTDMAYQMGPGQEDGRFFPSGLYSFRELRNAIQKDPPDWTRAAREIIETDGYDSRFKTQAPNRANLDSIIMQTGSMDYLKKK